MSSQLGLPGDPKKATGAKDPKKDVKPGAKGPTTKAGQPLLEDKHAPKAIELDYPEIDSHPNFIIVESDFSIHVTKHKQSIDKQDQKGAKQTALAMTAEEKRAGRMKELLHEFKIVRALPYSMAVKLELNKPKEIPKIEIDKEDDKPASQPDPKNKGKNVQPRKK